VTESHHPEIKEGERLFGYWPISDEVVLTPGHVVPKQLSDVSAHHEGLPQVYNNYMRVEAHRHYDPSKEAIRSLFDPLAGTSYGVAHYLHAENYLGAKRVLITSASSKTSFSIGLYLHDYDDAPEVVGLTSARHVEKTRETGGYDSVVSYDEALSLDPFVPTVIADVAGNGPFAAKLHAHLGDALTAHVTVGAAHQDAERVAEGSAREKMSEFFLPDYIAGFVARGDKSFQREMVAASARVGDSAAEWMTLVEAGTEEDISSLWQKVLAGELSPHEGGIIHPKQAG